MAHHHDKLYDALCAGLGELNPDRTDTLKRDRSLWEADGFYAEDKRRDRLRELVGLLRASRRAADARTEVVLAFPRQLLSHMHAYRDLFSRDPSAAAERAADTVVAHEQVVDAVKYVRAMRAQTTALEPSCVVGGYDAVTTVLSRRTGELSADMAAALWRAGGMTWAAFLERVDQLRAEYLGKLEPVSDSPLVEDLVELLRRVDPKGDDRRCPGCGKTRPAADADTTPDELQVAAAAYLPCCNDPCAGRWSTRCHHCHSAYFWNPNPDGR